MKVDMKGTKYSFNHKENLNSKHKNSFTYQKLDCDDDDEEEDNEIITEGNKLVPKNKIDWFKWNGLMFKKSVFQC